MPPSGLSAISCAPHPGPHGPGSSYVALRAEESGVIIIGMAFRSVALTAKFLHAGTRHTAAGGVSQRTNNPAKFFRPEADISLPVAAATGAEPPRIRKCQGGSSRILVGQFGEKIEPPAVEQDANAVVLELPEAASGRLDRLDPAVEPLCCGVANAVVEVVQKPL